MTSRPTIALLVSLLVTAVAHARGLDTEGERILEVLLEDGTQLNSALIAYPSGENWYFPLGETGDSLGISIKVSSALAKASGFVIDESRAFELDVRSCTVSLKSRTETYPCAQVQIYQEEIYVQQELLQKWFPVRFSLNLFRSQLTVQPLEPLPVQLRREREQMAERSKGLRFGYDPGYPVDPIPTKALDLPLIDEQLSFTRNAAGDHPYQLYNTVQAGAQVLGLETSALLAHDDRRILTSRLNFSKRDAEGGLFGPLNAREISAYDVVTPLMPLIANGAMGRGFSISSFPLNQPFAFDKHDFQGPLPNGWEVLLYRNEVLVDRQVSNESGTYFFRNVALFYGLNRFRLTFFGPYGQRRDEYHTLNVSPDMLQPDTGYYRLSYLQLDNGHQWATGQYTRNLSRNTTVNATVLNDAGGKAYGVAGISGMNERFLFTTQCAFATDGGKACEWSNQFGLEWLTAQAKYTRLFDFQSALFNPTTDGPRQTGQAELNVSYLLPVDSSASTTLQAMRRSYEGSADRTTFTHLIAFSAGRFYWNHRLNLDTNAAAPLSGRWDLSFVPGLSRFNFGLEYEPSRLTVLDWEMQANFSDKYLINSLISRRLTENVTNLQLTVSRYFDHFALGTTFATADFANYSVGLLLTIGLVPNARDGVVESVSRPVSQFGAATIAVYKDLNHNHQLDPGEPVIPDIRVTINQRELDQATNESGRIFLPYLQPHVPVDIAISIDSLKDPFLKAVKKGVRIIPRLGTMAHVDLPLEVVGEVDGAVEVDEGGGKRHGRRAFEMELVGLDRRWSATAKTDRDGYFLFDEVPPGRYRLQPKTGGTVPAERIVTVPEGGSFESGQNFVVRY